MVFHIRTATEPDIAGIAEVELAAGRIADARTPQFVAALCGAISDPLRLVLVAEAQPPPSTADGAAVVGWAKTHHWNHADGPAPAGHYLGGLTVAPAFRRKGAAIQLTDARLAWIWERGTSAWYVVNARNQASLELHGRWGFREVARAPGFHTVTFDGGEGVLLGADRPRTPRWQA
ncbi:GNAT family N-acetyltransferase [Paenarthrobacter sp. NPDC089675]|uniref:GNAT family N-acetyltransferase n=1 Tax=Paenarthrobacter sp. NPDC089675 TaxID=3364376 RepID=UPI003812FF20